MLEVLISQNRGTLGKMYIRVPKIRSNFLGSPHSKGYGLWYIGVYIGVPLFRETTICGDYAGIEGSICGLAKLLRNSLKEPVQ